MIYCCIMNHSSKRGSPYTHFIGVLVPLSLEETVQNCRAWMGERYGCRSGYRTTPHITLVSPFAALDDMDDQLLGELLSRWAASRQAFEGRVTGFGAFADRTIFARVVETLEWADWHDGLVKTLKGSFPGMLPGNPRPFTPHLTVANRDIPADAFAPALRHFDALGLDESFPVDRLALFAFRGGQWTVCGVWPAAKR